MGIINFNQVPPKQQKDWKEVERELYEKEKGNLPFNIGDRVKINYKELENNVNNFDDVKRNAGKEKLEELRSEAGNNTLEIIDAVYSFAFDDFMYEVNINCSVKILLSEHLIRV